MRPTPRFQFLISVALSSLALLATCHPRPATSSLISAVDRAQTSHDVGVASIQRRESDERAAATGLRPRALFFQEYLDIGAGWNMYYSSKHSVALPVQPAAWALTNLYATIAAQARGKWGKMPPQHAFTLTFGGVQIMMQCAQRPIPWLFVGNFAERLLQLTDTGWTGVYVLLFSQAQSDTSITVSLKLHV